METFVIRMVARGASDEALGPHDLRGVAEHVGSGRREPFRDERELLTFLHARHSQKPEEVDEQ